MSRRSGGSGIGRSLALSAACLALGACHSIHNPNVAAAERLPDGPTGWSLAPGSAEAEKPDCSSDSYRREHQGVCPPPRTDYHCDNPVVREALPQSCQPLEKSTQP
ncbi:hypothetical protein KK141_17735 [Dyella sp. LX-66]|uniref:hypothetical protein n=1 Tax=unclassified Dyella TaxID=2634549 RepID=UPI001BDF8C89|nr:MULTISPECIES: hypothetical protein [unclassified Dyella]MBT2117605.1 hypothetical protein [Dyella sp. LX-1]MBT2141391.1 hypothetical protein [Dyella sp. LX-66]